MSSAAGEERRDLEEPDAPAGGSEPSSERDESLEPSDQARDRAAELRQEADIAADYLERLLDLLDYDGEFDLDAANDRALVTVVDGPQLSTLVGSRGTVLDALQELTRRAVERQTGERSRLMLDIDGYREGRRRELTDLGLKTAERVASDGVPATLEPMNPFERKMVHDAVATVAGVTSESTGEEPQRCVVVLPVDTSG